MNKHTEELRQKYINNPPEGMTADEIRTMSDENLLTMLFRFLNSITAINHTAG